jgi:hypothetical protein
MSLRDLSFNGLVELRGAAVLTDGSRVDLLWIATRCDTSLRWDARRVFLSIGYAEIDGKEKTKFFHVFNRITNSFRPCASSIFGGESWLSLFGRSWHAQRKRSAKAAEDQCTAGGEHHWCSTVGLLINHLKNSLADGDVHTIFESNSVLGAIVF